MATGISMEDYEFYFAGGLKGEGKPRTLKISHLLGKDEEGFAKEYKSDYCDLIYKDDNGRWKELGKVKDINVEMDHKSKYKTIHTYLPESFTFEATLVPNGLPNSIKEVYFLDPYTVVQFDDGTMEVVKTKHGDAFDKEVGLAMALMKKQFGSRSKFKKFIENECKDQNSGK